MTQKFSSRGRHASQKPAFSEEKRATKTKFDKKVTSKRPSAFTEDRNSSSNRYDKKDSAKSTPFSKDNTTTSNKFVRKDSPKRPSFPDERNSSSNRYDKSEAPKRPFYSDNKKFTPNKFRRNTAPKAKPASEQSVDGIRLNRYISNSGICSRREADVYIKAGNVKINDKIVTEMGYKVQVTDVVKFDDAVINPETKRYLLLNKPKNYITTTDDERDRKTVMDLIANATKERLYPVGRLDRNTTGLLLFTNDGDMAKKLTHPKSNIKKLYHASLDKKLTLSHLQQIAADFVLDDKTVHVDEISYVANESKSEIGIEIHSGRNRIVRRIFEHFGYTVVKLDRVMIANLTKKNLPRGNYRMLTDQEVINLKML
ncbi:MAG: pseudouridine synthase [Flavobacteriales bacterium CG03_land_8_20_14_0_80_35_15]|nr:rRNA pseudouridine synthase [Zetaproteobacteria bacterium]OIO12163.1 MAG: hypothetical protein AUJ53_03045 [Flavobacteriaceae bacterium CG1_02_35_72]PIR14673.1 MAG: pseudouridine synthase [Flavobacteriales bacterium CG11_big_fil_rev_8_21_14_0_20_35_7]PIV16956.1 MAG: pseudouridine synthase [Flavobacteriales bacterium CG03_land_8_20_14_0_80_35_15]PIX07303.1 MAG: pseudouridine synthase [Flavobacteriales bacterium CG_4_8_14_3_um_filter_35_10]PJA04790.1 MAG: pseudouridine synthase [Flavobacteria